MLEANPEINVFTGIAFPENTDTAFDYSQLSDEQKMSLASMSQDEMATYIETYTENMSATYEDNLKRLGSVSLDNPDYIYTVDIKKIHGFIMAYSNGDIIDIGTMKKENSDE